MAIDWPAARLRVSCGTGTYLRSFARDLGERIGLPAHLTSLRRTAVGPLLADDGATLDEIAGDGELGERLRSPLALARLAGLDEIDLDPCSASMFAHGRFVPTDVPPTAEVAVTHSGGERLLGLAAIDAEAGLRPVVVLHSEAAPLKA